MIMPMIAAEIIVFISFLNFIPPIFLFHNIAILHKAARFYTPS